MTSTATARGGPKQAQKQEVVFADARAQMASELGQAVSEVVSSLPPEPQNLRAHTITFDPECSSKGTYAIFFAGTVVGTDREGVFMVPERSLTVLERLGIPYRSA